MDTIEAIRTRRVLRNLSDEPVPRELLEQVLECARWAPVAGNSRIHRFVAVEDPRLLKLVRMVSPGMYQRPQAAIVICADWAKADASRFSDTDFAPHIDLGTAMQTMMLAAHALGLGSGPVTSISKASMKVVLDLPQNLTPEIVICLGYPGQGSQSPMRSKKRVTWQSLVDWDRGESVHVDGNATKEERN